MKHLKLPQRSSYMSERTVLRLCSLLVIALTAAAILSASVAMGQASLDYDLACRSVMSSGGGTSTLGFYGLTSALGNPIAPVKETEINPTYSARSALYALRAGFLPGYPSKPAAAAANLTEPEQNFVQRLPIIGKVLRVVRAGC